MQLNYNLCFKFLGFFCPHVYKMHTGKVWSCLRFLFNQSQSPSYSTRWGKKNPWNSVTKGSAEICGNSILFLCRLACSTLVLFSPKTKKHMLLQFLGFLTVSKPRCFSLNNHHPTKIISEWPHDLANFIHLKHISNRVNQVEPSVFQGISTLPFFLPKKHMLEDNQTASKTNWWTDVVVMKQKLYF